MVTYIHKIIWFNEIHARKIFNIKHPLENSVYLKMFKL